MKRFKHVAEETIEEITSTNPSEYYRQNVDGKCMHTSHAPEHCPYAPPDDPGKWYKRKAEEAEAWIKLRNYALVSCLPSSVLRQLERHIEAARYVGD